MIPLPAAIVLIALTLASAALAAYWLAVAYQIRRTVRSLPTARHGIELSQRVLPKDRSQWPRVCIVIPAHNEERCIADVARAVAAQDYPPDRLSAVFVLDRCTDGTADTLRREVGHIEHFEVIEIDRCLEGWAGKTSAMHQGVRRSHAAAACDLLLFLDADTTPAPECVRATVALAKDRELPFLSLLSTLTTDEWFEHICQPVAGMEIVRQYPLRRANSNTHRRPFANGQFILIDRGAYERLGGHEAVKDSVLEDVELARAAHRAGMNTGLFIADRVLMCRMYPSWTRFVLGWKRIFAECANRRPSRLRKAGRRVVLIGTVLPVLAVAGAGAGAATFAQARDPLGLIALAIGALGFAAFVAVLVWAYRLAHAPIWTAFGYPVGCILVARILFEAARDLDEGRPTVWGGKQYARERR